MKHRSWLFVPGDSERKLAKIPDCGADVAILDLEDAVVSRRKPLARDSAAAFLNDHRDAPLPALWVRVNPWSSGLTRDDLAAVVPAGAAGIVLPKPDSVRDVRQLDEALTELEAAHGLTPGVIRVLAVATETALGVARLSSYTESPERLWGLAWGAEDLSAELGATTNRGRDGEFLMTYRMVRSLCQLAAAAAGKPAIDTLYADFRNLDGLRQISARARREGFVGMLAIHPGQIPIINAAFTPSAEDIEFARRVVDTFAQQADTGVVALDGKMLDRPHLRQARRMLQLVDTD